MVFEKARVTGILFAVSNLLADRKTIEIEPWIRCEHVESNN
jgi:hypothetical protein